MPHPVGIELDGSDDLEAALAELRRRRPDARAAVLKLDSGVSGLGNALVDPSRQSRDQGLDRGIALEDDEITLAEYLEALRAQGGIVEERIEGEGFASPSAQLRISPAGQVEVMSTHDQVLGGRHGHTYFGCHFPARPVATRSRSRWPLWTLAAASRATASSAERRSTSSPYARVVAPGGATPSRSKALPLWRHDAPLLRAHRPH